MKSQRFSYALEDAGVVLAGRCFSVLVITPGFGYVAATKNTAGFIRYLLACLQYLEKYALELLPARFHLVHKAVFYVDFGSSIGVFGVASRM